MFILIIVIVVICIYEKNKSKFQKYMCPICKTDLNREVDFCPACGYAVVKPKYNCEFEKSLSSYEKECIYYESEYYKCTKNPAAKVFSDSGMWGEYKLEAHLNGLYKRKWTNNMNEPSHLALEHKMLFNLLIPEPNGLFQEIDAIVIVEGYIFVFEVKNRKGTIEIPGNREKMWKQTIGNQVHTFYNPFLQNEEHIAALDWLLTEKYLPYAEKSDVEKVSFANFVVLADDCHVPRLPQWSGHESLMTCGVTTVISFEHVLKTIYSTIAMFYKNKKVSPHTHVLHGENANDAEKLYEFLLPYASFSPEQRDYYMEQRNMRAGETNKYREYRYAYVSLKKVEQNQLQDYILIRTNNVYWQCYGMRNGYSEWRHLTKTELELIKKGEIRWLQLDEKPYLLEEAIRHLFSFRDFDPDSYVPQSIINI